MLSAARVELLDIKEWSCPKVYISLLNLLVLTALELHRHAPAEHPDHSGRCSKTGYQKMTIIEPKQQEEDKADSIENRTHLWLREVTWKKFCPYN